MVWGDFARGERQKLPEFTEQNPSLFPDDIVTQAHHAEPTDTLFTILNLSSLSELQRRKTASERRPRSE